MILLQSFSTAPNIFWEFAKLFYELKCFADSMPCLISIIKASIQYCGKRDNADVIH